MRDECVEISRCLAAAWVGKLRDASEMMIEGLIAVISTVVMAQLHCRKGCAIP
jgi:hypothetical protein